jgi:hypothetical protein
MRSLQVMVEKVEIRPNMNGIVNFKGNPKIATHETKEGIYLYVEGVLKSGQLVNFFTDQTIIKKSTGRYVFQRLEVNPGGFFVEKPGEIIGHDEERVKENGKTKIIPSWIEDKTKIIPTINVGDSIAISYTVSEIKFEYHLLKNVQLLPNL